MAFVVDGSKAQSFERLPDGDYEVFITGAGEANSKSSDAKGIGLILTVRNDVEQQGKGRKVRHTVWMTDKTEGIVQGFLAGCNFPDGTSFADMAEIIEAVKALPIKVRLKANSNNPDFNEVASFKVSVVGGFFDGEQEAYNSTTPKPEGQANNNDPFAGDSNRPIDISDDDLPF